MPQTKKKGRRKWPRKKGKLGHEVHSPIKGVELVRPLPKDSIPILKKRKRMEKARDTRRAGTLIPEERDRNGLLASPKAPRG
jgi:hypothetical protein